LPCIEGHDHHYYEGGKCKPTWYYGDIAKYTKLQIKSSVAN
jgi:hypothetical protein